MSYLAEAEHFYPRAGDPPPVPGPRIRLVAVVGGDWGIPAGAGFCVADWPMEPVKTSVKAGVMIRLTSDSPLATDADAHQGRLSLAESQLRAFLRENIGPGILTRMSTVVPQRVGHAEGGDTVYLFDDAYYHWQLLTSIATEGRRYA